jgi:hypothetical protein
VTRLGGDLGDVAQALGQLAEGGGSNLDARARWSRPWARRSGATSRHRATRSGAEA